MTLLWMLVFPLAYIYIAIWGMWWPRHSIEHGRITAITFVVYVGWMVYSAFGSEIFDHIQRTF